MNGKSEKQSAFYREFLKDSDFCKAAVNAGYCEKRAEKTAVRLLRAAAAEMLNERKEPVLQISRDMVVAELKKVGFADLDTSPLKASDKFKALEMLCKLLGLDKPPEQKENGALLSLISGLKAPETDGG